ncbi:MAG: hypothetical protein ACOY31_01905 [Bacillota bacterium]
MPTNGSDSEVHLENVMFRLLEYQSGENVDMVDTMAVIGLVNLLGIVSVMNKKSPLGKSAPGAMENPMMPLLMSMLAQGGQNRREPGGGPPGINPALLLSLMGAQGQRPENALLLGLLTSMMQQPPAPPGYERETKGRPDNKETGEKTSDQGRTDIRRRVSVWDRRLG